MRKILLLFLTLLLATAAHALYTDNIWESYSFSEPTDANTILANIGNSGNLTKIGTGTFGQVPTKFGFGIPVSGFSTGGTRFNSSINHTNFASSWTVCVDIYRNVTQLTDTDNYFWFGFNNGGANFIAISIQGSLHDYGNRTLVQYGNGAGEVNQRDNTQINNTNTTLCVVKDETDTQTLIYVDGIVSTNSSNHSTGGFITNGRGFEIGSQGQGARPLNATYDEFYLWQRALTAPEILAFSTRSAVQAFNITQNTYNVTSAYLNATAWRTNTSATVFTYDATPTVTFETTHISNCSISTLNLNYTSMLANDSTTQCATISTVSHSCTLPITKHIVKGLQNIYIACNTTDFGQLPTSTSGPLAIQLDPVNITQGTYNVINAFLNATAWRVHLNNTVFMRNRQPNVEFNTSFDSNCSISKYDFNYTAMFANDSVSDCGDNNNITHACELPSSLQLVNGAQFIYIGCKSLGAESVGSTSGALNISMARMLTIQVVIQNGSGNSSHGSADVYLVEQLTNTTVDKNGVNSSGGVALFATNAGNHTVYGYDPRNGTIEGDIKNQVVVP